MQTKTQPPSARKGELRLCVSFDRTDLHLEYSLIGVVVHLADCPTVGEVGSPALPDCVVRVALPAQTRLTDVQADARETVRLSDEPLPIAPQQPLRPGTLPSQDEGNGAPPYRRPDEQQRDYRPRQTDSRRDKRFVEPFPTSPFVPANGDLYAKATRRPIARLVETTAEGLTPVATINLNPVRLTPTGHLEFSSQIDLVLRYEPATEDGQKDRTRANIVSRAQAMRQVALTRRTVINPEWVIDYSDLYPRISLNTDYLIITDNHTWNRRR